MSWSDIHTGGRGRRVKALVRLKQQVLSKLASTNFARSESVGDGCCSTTGTCEGGMPAFTCLCSVDVSADSISRAAASALFELLLVAKPHLLKLEVVDFDHTLQLSVHLVVHVLVLGVHPQKLLLQVGNLIFQFALSAPQLYQGEQRAVFVGLGIVFLELNQRRRFSLSWLSAQWRW